MAEKQLQAEQERLKVGLSTTRFVLDFQRDLATAQGNELTAIHSQMGYDDVSPDKVGTPVSYNFV